MKTKHQNYRYDVHEAENIIRKLLPSHASINLFAALFAASCRQANTQSPSCWEVTLDPEFVRLNVGPVALLSYQRGYVFIATLPLQKKPPTGLRYYFSPSKPIYPSVPIPSASLMLRPDKLNKVNTIILNSHLGYVTEAAIRRSVSVWRDAHSPAAVDYFGNVMGSPIPQPLYPITEKLYSDQLAGYKHVFEDIQKGLDNYAELDRKRIVYARREQAFLRQYLFRNNPTGVCALCGLKFPVYFLVAAHIKPRARCTEAEKRDYENNIVPMCVLGCDALFEKGWLTVEDGKVQVRVKGYVNERLRSFFQLVKGRPTTAWKATRVKYFNWHASNRPPSTERV